MTIQETPTETLVKFLQAFFIVASLSDVTDTTSNVFMITLFVLT